MKTEYRITRIGLCRVSGKHLSQAANEPPPHTGWPPGMLQDDDRGLSSWLANKPGARHQVDGVCAEIRTMREIEASANADARAILRDKWHAVNDKLAMDIQQRQMDTQDVIGRRNG